MAIKIGIRELDKLVGEVEKMHQRSTNVINKTMNDFKSRGPAWVAKGVVTRYKLPTTRVNKAVAEKRSGGAIKVGGKTTTNYQIVYRDSPMTLQSFVVGSKRKIVREKKRSLAPGVGFKPPSDAIQVFQPKPYDIYVEVVIGKKEKVKGKYGPPSFLAPTTGGLMLPFQRTGKTTGKGVPAFVSLKTLSVPQMILHEEVAGKITAKINDELGKRLDHHLNRELAKQ